MFVVIWCAVFFFAGFGVGALVSGKRRRADQRPRIRGIELPDPNDAAWSIFNGGGECRLVYCRGRSRMLLGNISICAECAYIFLGVGSQLGANRRYRDQVLSGILRHEALDRVNHDLKALESA